MAVSSRGILDTACTFKTSDDLRYYANEPSWLSWTPPLLQILLRSHGFPPRAVGVELGLAAEVVVAALDPDLQRLCSGKDTSVESNILFPS